MNHLLLLVMFPIVLVVPWKPDISLGDFPVPAPVCPPVGALWLLPCAVTVSISLAYIKHHTLHPAPVIILKIILRLPFLSPLFTGFSAPVQLKIKLQSTVQSQALVLSILRAALGDSIRYSPNTSRCPPAKQQLPSTRSLRSFRLANSEEYTRENSIYNFICLASTPKGILSLSFSLVCQPARITNNVSHCE